MVYFSLKNTRMAGERRSFFERLTGTVRREGIDEDAEEADVIEVESVPVTSPEPDIPVREHTKAVSAEEQEGQLTVDVYQTNDSIVIKSTIAGVKPDDLDVSITNDMVTIR